MKRKSLNIVLGVTLVISSALVTMAVLSLFGFLEWDKPQGPDTTSSVMKDNEVDPIETQPISEPEPKQVIEPKEVQAVEDDAKTKVEDSDTAEVTSQKKKALERLWALEKGRDISTDDYGRIQFLLLDNEIDAAMKELDSLPEYNPWAHGELHGDKAKLNLLLGKCKVFGVSLKAVVGYEMARARIPTPRIVETLKTYGSLNDYLLRNLDRISTGVDDRFLRQRLLALSAAIDRELSSGN